MFGSVTLQITSYGSTSMNFISLEQRPLKTSLGITGLLKINRCSRLKMHSKRNTAFALASMLGLSMDQY